MTDQIHNRCQWCNKVIAQGEQVYSWFIVNDCQVSICKVHPNSEKYTFCSACAVKIRDRLAADELRKVNFLKSLKQGMLL